MNAPNRPSRADWLAQAEALVLTPQSDRALPVAVVRSEGEVRDAASLCAEDGHCARLVYPSDGPQPVVILDFGPQSVGGYAVFRVTARGGLPVVRLAYACHPDGLSETGCFSRETSARYLGDDLDLPILPGNVNRHESYTIAREGLYIAPLLQGQTRYARLQLDTPGTSVAIDALALVNAEVYDRSPQEGRFFCSDGRLNRLWAISAWTLQLASFPNHDAWKTVDGWLLPRKLEQAPEIGLSQAGADWADITLDTTMELRANPHHVSAGGVAFRAQDSDNAYLATVALDGVCRLLRRQGGVDTVLCEQRLDAPLIDGQRYALAIEARGSDLVVGLDGVSILQARDEAFCRGRVGFYTPKEWWPLFASVRVRDASGRELLSDDFCGDLGQWQFARTLSYVADGAKRDRLVWSGDLYFAQRSAYYAFSEPTFMRDSLRMLAFNQTPEGYVHASPYPERDTPPPSGDYGPFPSDEFAAWLVPVAWDHLLYSGDSETARDLWPAIERLLAYLESHLGPDGLFRQRHETSKHAGDLTLGDVRTRAYMNILLWGTFRDAARIAEHLGLAAEREAADRRAQQLKTALYDAFWDEAKGYFREALDTEGFGPEANALALAMRLVTPEQAERIAPHFRRIPHGKFQSLAARGRMEYGLAQSGLRMLFDHNWQRLLDDHWLGAATTTECMTMMTKGWGDESHPDTAIAGHFSAYILGVQPLEPGYRRFCLQPQPTREVTWARGLVPTRYGAIDVAWDLDGDALSIALTVPEGTRVLLDLPEAATLDVNGQDAPVDDLPPGSYSIALRGIAPGAWSDPTAQSTDAASEWVPMVSASGSEEGDGWGLEALFAPSDDRSARGYRSQAHPDAGHREWLLLDLGQEVSLARLILSPSAEEKVGGGPGAGFPRDLEVQLASAPEAFETVATINDFAVSPRGDDMVVDLYTVIGYPSARFVRLLATRLGTPSAGEPGAYRLQIGRVRLRRA